jgi:hypothetical protein
VDNYNLCWPDVTWTNSNATCLLRKVQLRSFRLLPAPFRYEHGLGPNEPNTPLYPDGDPRNPNCVACGISGYEESIQASSVDPGDDFTLWGYFRNEACGGDEDSVALAQSLYFQTDAYTAGTILSFTEDGDGIKTYTVDVKGYSVTQVTAVDLFEPEVGDWVTIAKLNCYRDFISRFTEPLTDTSVCKNTSFKIVGYDVPGIGLGCG